MLKGNRHINGYLQNAFNKNGELNFLFEVIESLYWEDENKQLLKSEILKREQYWMDYYKSYDRQYGYNINPTAGSNLGMKFSEESKQRMRESEPSCRPIYQIDFDGNIVNHWRYGASEASKKLNIGQANIFKCLHKKLKTYKDYIWMFVEEFEAIEKFEVKPYLTKGRKSVIQTTLKGDFIKQWESLTEIERELGIRASLISRVCSKQRPHTHKFKWFYEEDYNSQINTIV